MLHDIQEYTRSADTSKQCNGLFSLSAGQAFYYNAHGAVQILRRMHVYISCPSHQSVLHSGRAPLTRALNDTESLLK